MIYISPENEYPRHVGDIALAEPSWSPDDQLPEGWTQVTEVAKPEAGVDEIVVEDFPVEIDGVMTQNWKVRPMTVEEIERRDAPARARARLESLGFTDAEIEALIRGLIR